MVALRFSETDATNATDFLWRFIYLQQVSSTLTYTGIEEAILNLSHHIDSLLALRRGIREDRYLTSHLQLLTAFLDMQHLPTSHLSGSLPKKICHLPISKNHTPTAPLLYAAARFSPSYEVIYDGVYKSGLLQSPIRNPNFALGWIQACIPREPCSNQITHVVKFPQAAEQPSASS